MTLEGKNVIVTGGATGIGRAIAHELVNEGAHVTIAARREDRLRATAAELGCSWMRLDVTDQDDVARVPEQLPELDVLVNNAGVMTLNPEDARDAVAAARREFDTNFIGAVAVTQTLLPLLRQRQGVVVNVSSGLAYVPWPKAATYSASKAALHSWTTSLRHIEPNVRFVEVLPPLTDTAMVEGVDIGLAKVSPERVARALVRALKGRRDQIPVGMSKGLALMSRVAPRFIEAQLAK